MPPMLYHIKSTVTIVMYNFMPNIKELIIRNMRRIRLTERRQRAGSPQEPGKQAKKKREGERGEYEAEMR